MCLRYPTPKADPPESGGWKEGVNHPERRVHCVSTTAPRNPWGPPGPNTALITSRMLSVFGESAPPLLENTGLPGSLSQETRPAATICPVDSLFPGALSLASALTLPTQGLGLSPWLDRGHPKRCSILHALRPTWALDRRPTAADTQNLRC